MESDRRCARGVLLVANRQTFCGRKFQFLLRFRRVGVVPSVRTSRGIPRSNISTHKGEGPMAQSQHATSSFHKPLPYLSPGQIKEICEATEMYIAEQRSGSWWRGMDLTRDQVSSRSAFFRTDVLH